MNCNREPVQDMVSEAVAAATGDPIVAAPRGAVDGAVAALAAAAETACRILVPRDALDQAGWGTRGRLREMIERDSQLRTAEIDTPAVVGDRVQAVAVRSGLGTSSWIDDDPSDSDVRETLERVWERSNRVDLDCPSTTTVCDTVEQLADGAEARRLRNLTSPARDRDLDRTSTVVWAAAGGKPYRGTLVDSVSDATGVSERTVSRRIRGLQQSGILTSERDPTAIDGRGPPPTRVVRDVEPPLSRLQQEVLQ